MTNKKIQKEFAAFLLENIETKYWVRLRRIFGESCMQ